MGVLQYAPIYSKKILTMNFDEGECWKKESRLRWGSFFYMQKKRFHDDKTYDKVCAKNQDRVCQL